MRKVLEGRTILIILLLGFALYFLISATAYGRNSRIFPEAIGIPTVLLTALLFVAVWKPGLLRVADIRLRGDSREAATLGSEEGEEEGHSAARLLRILGWLLLAAVGIYLAGFRLTVPIYILLFARLEGRIRWIPCLLVAVLSWAFLVGYFEIFMKFAMFRGVLFGDILPLY